MKRTYVAMLAFLLLREDALQGSSFPGACGTQGLQSSSGEMPSPNKMHTSIPFLCYGVTIVIIDFPVLVSRDFETEDLCKCISAKAAS